MWRRLGLLLLLAAGLAAPAAAQITTVSGTITDPNGIPYSGGTIKAVLSAPGATVTINNQGQCSSGGFGTAPCQVPIQGTVGPTSLDGNGSFTLNLYDRAQIRPTGTTWTFTVGITPGVAPPFGTGGQSFTVTLATITGPSIDISTALSAAAPALSRGSFGGGITGCGGGGNLVVASSATTGNCTPAIPAANVPNCTGIVATRILFGTGAGLCGVDSQFLWNGSTHTGFFGIPESNFDPHVQGQYGGATLEVTGLNTTPSGIQLGVLGQTNGANQSETIVGQAVTTGTGLAIGIEGNAYTYGSSNVSVSAQPYITGVIGSAQHFSTGTVPTVLGFTGQVQIGAGSGAVINAAELSSGFFGNNTTPAVAPTATVATYAGWHHYVNAGSGAGGANCYATTCYGLLIDNMGTLANEFAIKATGKVQLPALQTSGTQTSSVCQDASGNILAISGVNCFPGGTVFPVTVSGTVNSGGIPCFTSTTNEASSGTIAAGVLIKGGGAGACAAASSITDNGTTVSTSEGVSAGSLSATGNCNTGTAGCLQLTQGTAPSSLPANTIVDYAPTSVTAYGFVRPSTAATGIAHWSASGATVTESVSSVATADIANNAVGSAQMAVVNTRRVCDIPVGDTSGSAISNAQLGPQSRVCYIPAASVIVEMDVNADAGTPNVIVGRNHAGTIANIVSAALATAGAGGIACSNTGGTTGINGATTCTNTLQNTALAAGDYLELVSGTAGGTAKFFVAHIIYTVN